MTNETSNELAAAITMDKVLYPSGNGTNMISIDMINIRRLAARLNEVAMVNKIKAPELMQAFTEGYCLCGNVIPRIGYELTKAKTELDRRVAIITLDIAPQKLKDQGLVNARNPAGSADLRQSVINTDDEYLKIKDRVNQIEAAWTTLKMVQHGFEMSFSAVKKVFDTLSQYGQLQGGADTSIGTKETNVNMSDVGTPRY